MYGRFTLTYILAIALCLTCTGLLTAQPSWNELLSMQKEAIRLHRSGEYRKSEELFLRVLADAGRVWGEGRQNHANTMQCLANLYTDIGRYAEAEMLLKRTIKIRETILGAGHQDTAEGYFNLSRVHIRLGQYSEAEALLKRSLTVYEGSVGKNHLYSCGAVNGLANVYFVTGRYAEAEELFKRALSIRQTHLPKDDPEVIEVISNLGAIFSETDRYDEAEAYYKNAIELTERRLGKVHPVLAHSFNAFANHLLKIGRTTEAESYFRRALEIRDVKLGKHHYEYADVLNNIANVYRSSARYADAEPLYRQSLAIYEQNFGKKHPRIALALHNCALLSYELGRFGESESLARQAMEVTEACLGRDHPDMALCLNTLANVCGESGRHAEAEQLYNRSIMIFETRLGKDHVRTAVGFNNLGRLHLDAKRYAEAEQPLRRSLAIYEAKLGLEHPDLTIPLLNLARAHMHQGKLDSCESLLKRTTSIIEAKFGHNHPRIASIMETRIELDRKTGRADEVDGLLQQILEIRRARLGKAHPLTASAQRELSVSRFASGRHSEAVRLMHTALQLQRVHQVRLLPMLSERDQLTYLKKTQTSLDDALTMALANPLGDENAARTASWLVNGKAVAQQAVADRLLLSRGVDSPDGRRMLAELTSVRQELARLTLEPPKPGAEEHSRTRKEELTERERSLSSRLGHQDARATRDDPWVELDEVMGRLPEGGVYLDFVRYAPRDYKVSESQPVYLLPRYAAWLTTADGRTRAADLGDAASIDSLIKDARTKLESAPAAIKSKGEIEAERELQPALKALSDRLLAPFRKELAGSTRWVVCPDADLWLVPWSALPLDDTIYIAERHAIRLVISGRDLVVDPLRLDLKASQSVVIADPDFNASPISSNYRLAGLKCHGTIEEWRVNFHFADDGDTVEIRDAADGSVAGTGKWKLEGSALTITTSRAAFTGTLGSLKASGGRSLRNDDGTTTSDRWEFLVEKRAGSEVETRGLVGLKLGSIPRLSGTAAEGEVAVSLLAKHYGEKPTILTDREACAAAVRALRSPRVLVLATHGYVLPSREPDKEKPSSENPLLQCGLLLAGCNLPGGESVGVLTGLDVAGLDLRGTELAVLSACETGLGEVRSGEGVAGLRQAFQLAGAQSVIATLWQVPDRDSAILMSSFFGRIANTPSRDVTLAEAQREMIKNRRDRSGATHPYFWAAYTLTGRN